MTSKKHLATITALVKDRQANSQNVNQILTDSGHLVLARLGVNVEPRCISHCTGLISVVCQGSIKEIEQLTKKLDSLYGITARKCIITK